LDIKVIC